MDDVNAMVEAVLDVLAPKIPPDVLAAVGGDPDSGERLPVIRLGGGVMPSDEDMRGLAEAIVTAIRTATTAPEWTRVRDTLERPVSGGLTAVISPTAMVAGMYVWAIVARGTRSDDVKAAGGPVVTAAVAKEQVAYWEDAERGSTDER